MLDELRYFAREIRRRPLPFLLRKGRHHLERVARELEHRMGGRPYAPRWCDVPALAPLPFWGGDLVGALPDALEASIPDARDRTLERAEELVGGRFRCFGREIALDADTDWSLDPVSGARWDSRFHTRYRYRELIDLTRRSDIKVPWELGRLQFLPTLALAHRLTGEERFLRTLLALAGSFRTANPVGIGIQWTAGLEVALRAISLLWTREILAGSPGAKQFASPEAIDWIAAHGRFLARNLEDSDVRGNHYSGCLLGLLYLGISLPAERESRRWLEVATAGLATEILHETFPDGVCHEGSIPYHRFVLEIFLHAHEISRRCDLDLGGAYGERLGRMFSFATACLEPDGSVPVWGDADDATVLALGASAGDEHRSLPVFAALRLGRGERPERARELSVGALLLGGPELAARLSDPPKPRPPHEAVDRRSVGFPEGGFFILRADSSWCLVDCGPVGLRGRGGHGHHDTLSVEVVLDGRSLLRDTGCSSYTRSVDERLACLSAAAHNAPVIADGEPAPFTLGRLPQAGSYPAEIIGFDPDHRTFVGRHRGWADLTDFDFCERRVVLGQQPARVLIEDLLQGRGRLHVVWNLHLDPRWRAETQEAGDPLLLRDALGGSPVELHMESPEQLRTDVLVTPLHPAYDQRLERTCIRFSGTVSLPFRSAFVFVSPSAP